MGAQRSTHVVLVVEDEPILRLDIAETFLAAGFRTFEAGTALEAIKILERHPEIGAVLPTLTCQGRWTACSSPMSSASVGHRPSW
jgi:CheY-like chemotaxis protein